MVGTVYRRDMAPTLLTILLCIGLTSSNPIGAAANGAEQEGQEALAQGMYIYCIDKHITNLCKQYYA